MPTAPAFPDLAPTGLTPPLLDALLDSHTRQALPRLRLLWAYYRNPMQAHAPAPGAGGLASRGWRLAQEKGLPARLRGLERSSALDDRRWARKEIVIENDIAWRIHAMVDFLLAGQVRITSTAADPALRQRINAALDSVWEASGGITLMQDMALLGNIYGSVDLVVRADQSALKNPSGEGVAFAAPALTPSTTDPSASAHADREREEAAPPRDLGHITSAAAQSLRIEVIDPPRGVALLSPGDYRSISAYIIRAEREEAAATTHAPTRFNTWRRALAGLVSADAVPAPPAASRPLTTITDILGPKHRRVYQTTPDGVATLIFSAPSLVNPDRASTAPPVVHIQNLSQPFNHEGLSEVEPLIPLQDELNTRLSDRASRVTLQSFRMFLAKGLDGADQMPVGPGTIWTTDNPDADITPFGGDADSPSESDHIEQIREALDKQSGVPPLASGVVRAKIGNLSSENALKITLMGLLSKTARKRVAYGRGIAEASRLVLEALDALNILNTTPDQRSVRVDWPDPLPRDERQALAAALQKVELGVPRQTVLSELGYSTADPGVQ